MEGEEFKAVNFIRQRFTSKNIQIQKLKAQLAEKQDEIDSLMWKCKKQDEELQQLRKNNRSSNQSHEVSLPANLKQELLQNNGMNADVDMFASNETIVDEFDDIEKAELLNKSRYRLSVTEGDNSLDVTPENNIFETESGQGDFIEQTAAQTLSQVERRKLSMPSSITDAFAQYSEDIDEVSHEEETIFNESLQSRLETDTINDDSWPAVPHDSTHFSPAGTSQRCLRTPSSQRADATRHLSGLKRHKQKSCPICGRQMSTSNLARHMAEKHGNQKKFQCDQCGRKFTRNDSLVSHRVSMHSAGLDTGAAAAASAAAVSASS